jgi:hypothetical protein
LFNAVFDVAVRVTPAESRKTQRTMPFGASHLKYPPAAPD